MKLALIYIFLIDYFLLCFVYSASTTNRNNANKFLAGVNAANNKMNNSLAKRTFNINIRAKADKKLASKSLDAILDNAVSGILASMNKETKESLHLLEKNRHHGRRKFKLNSTDSTDTRTKISTRQLLGRHHEDAVFEGNGELLDPFDITEPTVLDGNVKASDDHDSSTAAFSKAVDSNLEMKSLTPQETETMKKLLHSEDADAVSDENMKASSKAAISKYDRKTKTNRTSGKYDYLNLNVGSSKNKHLSPLLTKLLLGKSSKYVETLTDDPEYDIVDEYNKNLDKNEDSDMKYPTSNEITKVSNSDESPPIGEKQENSNLDLSEAVNDMQAVISTGAFQKNASAYKNVSDYEVIVEKSIDDKKHIDIKEPDFNVSLALNSSVIRDRDVKTLENVIRMLTAMKFRENITDDHSLESSEAKHNIGDDQEVFKDR